MMTSVALAQTARRAGVALLLVTALAGNAARSYGQSGAATEPEAASPAATGGEGMALHAAVPPLAASPIHPLFGWTLSLAGVVGLAGDERPTVQLGFLTISRNAIALAARRMAGTAAKA